MTFLEIARRWTILFLAETLKTTTDAIAAVLPFQPRWLAQIALLASQLRAAADRSDAYEDDAAGEDDPVLQTANPVNLEALLASHARLRQAAADIGARGLALDPELLQRMRAEWNVESVISYLSTAEKNLREAANRALNEAAVPLGMSVAAMTDLGPCALKVGPPASIPPAGPAKTTAAPRQASAQ
jgi:hypothetical protein